MRPLPRGALAAALAAALTFSAGCYAVRPSHGAGEIEKPRTTTPDAGAIELPPGYRVERVATGLNFPVGITFDENGRPFVVESGYSYGEVFTEPQLLRLEDNGTATVVAKGGHSGPWTGVAYARGNFYVADGNVLGGGRLLRIARDGRIDVLVSGLPSFGDHHTDGPVIGPDGWIYFAQGTATNSGVVGEDNLHFGWLKRHPEFHDVPARDITLAGENFETPDALHPGSGSRVTTGAFLPYGTPSQPGQVVRGNVRASGTVLRVRPEGGEPELVAWGFRNPFGLAFSPDGQLYVTENGYDDRGSRGVWGAPDVLWRIEPGKWYGWPDYAAGMPLTDPRFAGPGRKPLKFLLAQPPNPVPAPVALFAVHASADGFDFSRSPSFGYVGHAFVALFGDQAPATGKILEPVGGTVESVDPATGVIARFAVNRAKHEGPATREGTGGLERPVAARFNPAGDALYVVDFGVMRMAGKKPEPQQHTGVVWKIWRQP